MAFPVDEDRIRLAEAALGRALPRELRRRLRTQNGGEVEAHSDVCQLHPVWDDRDRRQMRRTANPIVRETKAAAEWPAWPSGAVSIAQNGTGDHLVLLKGSETPRHFNHETGACQPVRITWKV